MKIHSFFEASHETYGAVRIRYDLMDDGVRVGKNTVAMLMRKAGLIQKIHRGNLSVPLSAIRNC